MSVGMRRCENELKSGPFFRLPLADTRLTYIGMMAMISAWVGTKALRSPEMSCGVGEVDHDSIYLDSDLIDALVGRRPVCLITASLSDYS